MSDLNILFRERIGFSPDEMITFDNLEQVLEKTAKAIPFENLCVLNKDSAEITKENVVDKIIKHNEGGLCYELNYILYLFLLENGFNISLIRGNVYNQAAGQWSTIGKTHITNLIIHNGEPYLVDTGFGANLPLKPVPLNSETVTSSNGEFRVQKVKTEHGDCILYVKLKNKDKQWKIGYAFDSKATVQDLSELNDVKQIIRDHPESPFNKKPLVNRLTARGSFTLANTSFTIWDDGQVEKVEIDNERFKKIAKEQFGIYFS